MGYSSSRTKILFCSIFFLFFLFHSVQSVDKSKFKTCSQSNFCKRNRNLNPQDFFYEINSTSIKVSPSTIEATLYSIKHPGKPLSFRLQSIENGIIQIKIDEKNSKRYQGPKEVLVPFNLSNFEKEPIIGPSNMIIFFGDVTLNQKVEVQFTPFRVDFYVDKETLIMSLNEKNMFNLEFIRSKAEDEIPHQIPMSDASKPDTWIDEEDGFWEPPLVPNPAVEGRWEETYGTHKDSKKNGPTSISFDITFHNISHLYGIPEHADHFALRSTFQRDPYRLYNLDVFEYETETSMALYGSIPYILGHNKHHTVGFFYLNPSELWIDVDPNPETSEKRAFTHTHWMTESGIFRGFFFLGPTPQKVFKQYSSLTGVTSIPPLWSLGYHQCKWNYRTSQEVEEVDEGFDRFNIPYDTIWLDIEHTEEKKYFTWDKRYFPDPLDMQNKIAAKGRKMVTIIDPHIKKDDNYPIYKSAQEENLFVRNHEGNEYEGKCWPGTSSWIDYLNPKARDWWADRFDYQHYQLSTPILHTWNDMNEPAIFEGPEGTMDKDAMHYGGAEHRDVHNVYGFYQHGSTYQGLLRRDKGNERPFVLSRAFFAGSQRHGAIWTGDNAASWDHLDISTPMLLSISVAGLPFCGADVGGFFGNPDATLLTRWYQAGIFSPFFRAHGHLDSKRREPWLFEEPYVSIIRQAIRLRYSLLPYWYTLFYEHSINGSPVMRPLWVEFPAEESIFNEEGSFMIGDSLLARPITKPDVKSIQLYLPGTQPWYDLLNGKQYNGSETHFITTPLERIPVFVKGGSIVPMWSRVRRSTQKMLYDPYTLLIVVDDHQKAHGKLYVDDGHSLRYQAVSDFVLKEFTFANNQLHCTTLAHGSASYVPNSVNKIEIWGLKQKPASILVHKDDKSQEEHKIEFEYFEDQHKLVIRKPHLLVQENWTLFFN